MQSSSTQRLRNDINECEDSSDRKIPADSYYVVKIVLDGDVDRALVVTTVKELARKNFDTDGRPLVAYTYGVSCYLLFSSLEGTQHFLGGSHHAIISFYASYFAKATGHNARCSIVELDSRTRILIYFQSKIYENGKLTVRAHLSDVSEREFATLTFTESIKLLAKRSSIRWEDLAPSERYGTFYKLVSSNGKDRFAVMSEMIDIRDQNRYISYLFE
jgi:hypothetical protein